MAKSVWTLDQRATLFLLKSRFQLNNEDARTLFYRIYSSELATDKREYTAKNLDDEFAQRHGKGKPKMWKDIDKIEHTAQEEAHFDRLVQGIRTAAAQQPIIPLVAMNPPYKHKDAKSSKAGAKEEDELDGDEDMDGEDAAPTAANGSGALTLAINPSELTNLSAAPNSTPVPSTLPPGTIGQPLRMIHARDLPAQDGSGKYTIISWDNVRFVTKDSKLYQCGGPVASIKVNDAAACDVMLCYKDICGYCSYPETGDEAHQAAHALASDNGVEGDPTESPFKGLAFFHIIGNTKKGEKARQFDAATPTDWSVPASTFTFQAWFDDRGLPDGQLALRRCLICQADACRVCSGDEKVDQWERDRAPGGVVYEKRREQWEKDRAEREADEAGQS